MIVVHLINSYYNVIDSYCHINKYDEIRGKAVGNLGLKGFIIIMILCTILTGCGIGRNDEGSINNLKISKEPYMITQGYAAELSENYTVVWQDGLNIIDLATNKIIKEIAQPNRITGGYDISGTKVVWSQYSDEGEDGKDYSYDESTNTDIYLYDISVDSTIQITTNIAGQIAPDIWGDYIVWQDNRNDTIHDNNPEWDIYLYYIPTKEEKLITTAKGIHTNPQVSDNIVVWEDGRNFTGESIIRWGSNVPENNTDIFLYNIITEEEKAVATGDLQEGNPCVSGNYIVWEDRNKNRFEADIYLYDIEKNKTRRITDDKYNQAYPRIFDHYIVWMDERNGISTNDVIINNKVPNSDIFLYDIDQRREYLLTGEEPQIMPAISENYIAFITSRQVNPEIQVIKYR
jgi:beta propeller repeat protein